MQRNLPANKFRTAAWSKPDSLLNIALPTTQSSPRHPHPETQGLGARPLRVWRLLPLLAPAV